MVGIVLVTHGGLGRELLRTAEGIIGPLDAARTVSLEPHDSLEQGRGKLSRAIAEVDGGEGVLVLTDMFGGTPSNLALTFLDDDRHIEVVTGVNLPMVLKLGASRDEATLAERALAVAGAGQKNIVFASNLLRGAMRERASGPLDKLGTGSGHS